VFSKISAVVGGNRLMARVVRSASWIVLGYGASQAIRLASNVILARILFPEAFGLMALISLVTVGLMLFSDVGIAPSIAQSKRGDDPDFLNTAWSIQIVRGFCLWITAHRHLLMGRLTALDLASQVIGIIVMIVLAWITQSVMSLVIGGVVGAVAKLALTHYGLPGERNRMAWEKPAVKELITFGKWIFLSTVFWFFASQGDKAVLGKFLTLETLGIYNIGYFLASFPLLLGLNVTGRVMIPIYRETDGGKSAKLTKMRYGLTAGVMGLLIVMALIGPWLTGLLYDARYLSSGAILVLICVALIPQVIGMTYDQAALAAGDSRRFFMYSAARSTLQVGLLLLGAIYAGLVGALIGMGVAMALAHFVLIWLARAHHVWDARHDGLFAVVGLASGAGALWLHWDAIVAMVAATSG